MRAADVLILSLRAGVGLNGLQEVCDTLVFGEFDRSPGVHEQVIGRLQRDGQVGQVTAYFLHSSSGADPVMTEVLGLKTEQVEGIRNPDRPLVEKLQRGEDAIRRVAQQYVQAREAAGSTAPRPTEREASRQPAPGKASRSRHRQRRERLAATTG